MTRLKAVLWDVDGTIAETERDGHRVAFNLAFEAQGLPWRWDEATYGELLKVAGGRERLMHDMNTRSDAPVLADQREALARLLHSLKNKYYAECVRGGAIPLRPGVAALMQQCREQGVRMAITTTTSRANVDALLGTQLGPDWAGRFAAIVCGEDVQRKKPDPEVFEIALQRLALDPLEAVAIEDSPGGVAAAREASVPVIVTRSAYFDDATIEGAIAIGPGLHQREGWRPGLRVGPGSGAGVNLEDVESWFAQMDTISQFSQFMR